MKTTMRKNNTRKTPVFSTAQKLRMRLGVRSFSACAAIGATLALGCAARTGVIEVKSADGSARVLLPARDLKVGDEISLLKEGCEGDKSRYRIPSEVRCRDHVRATGKVERVVGSGRADVRFEPGLSFEPGDTVEIGHR